MNDQNVARIAIGSFFAGMFVQAYHQVKAEKRLKKHIELLKLDNQRLYWYVNEGRYLSREEMQQLLEEKTDFIKLVKRLK